MSPIPEANKPIVGIVYSESTNDSSESKNLAYFLSGSLVSTGFAKVNLVGLSRDGAPCDLDRIYRQLFRGAISFLPPGKSSRNEAKSAAVAISDGSTTATSNYNSRDSPQICLSHWNELQNCQVIIVTVNSNETEACSSKLAACLSNSLYHVVVFSLQRGVRNGGILKDGLRSVEVNNKGKMSSGVAVVEGIAAFACVPVSIESKCTSKIPGKDRHVDAEGHFYACTIKSPQLMLERLGKDIAEVADGPVNLLDTMGFDIQFRKTLTPFSWGILLYENLYALNIVTGGDLSATLNCRKHRLILGLMVRETRAALLKAAGSGKWTPDMSPISFHLTPWMFEMSLVAPLPNFFFNIFWAVLHVLAGTLLLGGQVAMPGVRSPGQCDIASGRKTMAEWHINEIISTGERYKVDTPICSAVLSTIQSLEASILSTSTSSDESFLKGVGGTYSLDANSMQGRMFLIYRAFSTVTSDRWHGHPGVWEASYRLSQAAAVLLMSCFLLYELL